MSQQLDSTVSVLLNNKGYARGISRIFFYNTAVYNLIDIFKFPICTLCSERKDSLI